MTDNIVYYDHWNPEDFNVVIKWRTLAPTTVAHRNVFVVSGGANATGNLELFHDHSSTQKHQWDGASWDDNLYFREESHGGTPFGSTWPMFGDLSSWRGRGKDVHSLLVDPRFVDVASADFRLRAHSPALALGFQEWDHSAVGPDCQSGGSAGGTVACA